MASQDWIGAGQCGWAWFRVKRTYAAPISPMSLAKALTSKALTASGYGFFAPSRGSVKSVQWNIAPYPALANQPVLARCARALSSAAIVSAVAEAGRTSRHRKRTASSLTAPDTWSVTGFIPRAKCNLPASCFRSKLTDHPPSVGRYTPSVGFRSELTELGPEITFS